MPLLYFAKNGEVDCCAEYILASLAWKILQIIILYVHCNIVSENEFLFPVLLVITFKFYLYEEFLRIHNLIYEELVLRMAISWGQC